MDEIIDDPRARVTTLGTISVFLLADRTSRTYTGITDDDRSLTIRKLAHAAASPDETGFAGEFRAPGHVYLLKRHPDCWPSDRATQNSASSSRRRRTGPPLVVVCESLHD